MTMKNDGNDGNRAASELAEYLLHEASRCDIDQGSPSTEDTTILRRHALEQLVESRLGADLTAAASRLAAEDASLSDDLLSDAAIKLMESASFQEIQDAVEECSSQLPIPASATSSMAAAAGERDSMDNTASSSSKKAKTPQQDSPPDTAAPAPTSFSLFDLLDSQKGAFALPPRIMAHQIIETHQREQQQKSQKSSISDGMGYVDNSSGGESTLELLEKADDIEDLSPDPDSWEEVRRILYEGLISVNDLESQKEAFRYLKVHETLFEKCRGNNACAAQSWSLVQNLVGSILTLSRRFEDKELPAAPLRLHMDLCWDITQSLLKTLSHLAADYVVSCVGNEREIERMLLGMCMILSNDNLACILGMMEPMAGWFEVWSRFVDPGRFVTIVHTSGIGGMMLHRCDSLGKSTSCENIWNMIQSTAGGGAGGDNGDSSGTSLADIEHCNFLQSLSVLRTILFRCGGSRQVVSMLHKQYICVPNDLPTATLELFLLPHGVASPDEVQTLLKKVEEDEAQKTSSQSEPKKQAARGDVNSVLKPFRATLQVKKSNATLVDNDVEILCTQTIQLLDCI